MIHPLNPVWQMGLIVLVVLVFSSALVALMRLLRPRGNFSELSSRIKAWWIMAGVFFGAIAVSNRISLVFFAFLSFWALKEYITLLKTRAADHRALVWVFLSVPIQYFWVGINWYGMAILFIPVYMFLFLPIRLVLARETAGFVASASQMQWGLMAFVFGLSHLALLLTLPAIADTSANGRTLLLFLVFVVEMSDVLQFVWGKTLGRHPILPTVSPNKTLGRFSGRHYHDVIGGLAHSFFNSIYPAGNGRGGSVADRRRFLWRRGDERREARLWREGFWRPDSRPRRNARPGGLALLRRADIFPLSSVFPLLK